MSVFAARYARAFADVVGQIGENETGGATAVEKQLNGFLAAWDESPELREVFGDPSVPVTQKVAVIDAMKPKLHLAPHVRNFLAVLIEHDRITAVHEIVAEYHKELQERLGIHQAEIVTARELNSEDKAALVEKIGTLVHGKVDATFTLDKSILGGVVVKIGSTVYDGSVAGRFERLREELSN
jgi:F-type H+-transporting ATPase subunit delta